MGLRKVYMECVYTTVSTFSDIVIESSCFQYDSSFFCDTDVMVKSGLVSLGRTCVAQSSDLVWY
jgi:hypothetical protein